MPFSSQQDPHPVQQQPRNAGHRQLPAAPTLRSPRTRRTRKRRGERRTRTRAAALRPAQTPATTAKAPGRRRRRPGHRGRLHGWRRLIEQRRRQRRVRQHHGRHVRHRRRLVRRQQQGPLGLRRHLVPHHPVRPATGQGHHLPRRPGEHAVRLISDSGGAHCEHVAKLASVTAGGSRINISTAAVDQARSAAFCQPLDPSNFTASDPTGIQHDVGPAHGDGYHYERAG
ncbi:hypothetical protein NKH18_28810 [Streptomyces sp. M10(2022)]